MNEDTRPVNIKEAKRRRVVGMRFFNGKVMGTIIGPLSPRNKVQAELACSVSGCTQTHTREISDWHQSHRCKLHATKPKSVPATRGEAHGRPFSARRPRSSSKLPNIPTEKMHPRLQEWGGLCSHPTLVHADWSGGEGGVAKRWYSVAEWKEDHYEVTAPRLLGGDVDAWLTDQLARQTVVLGFDFAMGVPEAFPTGQESFPEFLSSRAKTFFEVATTLESVGPTRPFFRGRGKGIRKPWAEKLVGSPEPRKLLRRCEQEKTAYARPAAQIPFWCIGANQVGPATIHGWRNILIPALKEGVALWPFHGADLAELVRKERRVIVETYPGDAYSVLGKSGNKKRTLEWRAAAVKRMREVISQHCQGQIVFSGALNKQLDVAFGPGKCEEDPFDATVGAILMAFVALGKRSPGLPASEIVRAKEGWILGCDGDSAS